MKLKKSAAVDVRNPKMMEAVSFCPKVEIIEFADSETATNQEDIDPSLMPSILQMVLLSLNFQKVFIATINSSVNILFIINHFRFF